MIAEEFTRLVRKLRNLWPALLCLLLVGCGEYGTFIDNVTSTEMKGILKQTGLPKELSYKPLRSYARNLPPPNNDYFNVYAFRVTLPASLISPGVTGATAWESGIDTNSAHLAALRQAEAQAASVPLPWLPTAEQFSSTNYVRRFVRLNVEAERVNPAAFMAYDPKTNVLYYVRYKL